MDKWMNSEQTSWQTWTMNVEHLRAMNNWSDIYPNKWMNNEQTIWQISRQMNQQWTNIQTNESTMNKQYDKHPDTYCLEHLSLSFAKLSMSLWQLRMSLSQLSMSLNSWSSVPPCLICCNISPCTMLGRYPSGTSALLGCGPGGCTCSRNNWTVQLCGN